MCKKIEFQLIYSWYKKALTLTLIWNIKILVLFEFNKLSLNSQLKLSSFLTRAALRLIHCGSADAMSRASSWEWFFTPIKHRRSRVRRHLS